MIGLMPRYVPRFLNRKRRPLAYSRPRRARPPRRSKGTPSHERTHAETIAFDHGPAEFPMATVRPTEPRAQIIAAIGALQRWLVARWQWFKPRTMPCVIAAIGMLAVIAAADYLAHHIDQPQPDKSQQLILLSR